MGMRMLVALAIVCLTGMANAADEAWPNKPEPGLTVLGRVIEVHDGDTVTIEVRTKIHVRLLDCWCPEIRTKDPDEKWAGLKAKGVAEMLALEKECTLSVPGSGLKTIGDLTSMGRVLGYVWIGDDPQSLSEQLVAAGVANRDRPRRDAH